MADYLLNTNVYAKNCENKARPKMHCNGKCQMMKKIREEESKNQQNSERKAENLKQVLSSQSSFATVSKPPFNFTVLIRAGYINQAYIFTKCFDIFHPPKVQFPLIICA
jgi:hypothetical protein